MMINTKKMALIYTILHFLVDFTTIFLISGVLLGPHIGMVQRGLVVIVYNLVAFAGQLPMGMIADVIGRNRLVAAFGCSLAGLAFPLSYVSPWTACVCAALGNGAFHIGAGVDILAMSMPKAGLSGVFVSSGAFGVWLAYKSSHIGVAFVCTAFMLLSALMLYITEKKSNRSFEKPVVRYDKPQLYVVLSVMCFNLTVVIRSLLGTVMNFSWKAVPVYSFLLVIAVVGGKAIGGYLGDRFGYLKTAVLSLAVSLVSFVFSFDFMVAAFFGVLCFNMTMPLTLTAIAGVCNRKYGFAFGLTTFALAIGFVPVVFGANNWFGVPMLVIGVGISLILMVLGYNLIKK